MGVASMVLGILALSTNYNELVNLRSFVFAVLALIFAIVELSKKKDQNKSYRKMAIAGLVMSIVVLGLSLLNFIFSYYKMIFWMF